MQIYTFISSMAITQLENLRTGKWLVIRYLYRKYSHFIPRNMVRQLLAFDNILIT